MRPLGRAERGVCLRLTPGERLQLVEAIVAAGVRDIVVSSGIEDPQLLLDCLRKKLETEQFPETTRFVFVILLNTWEPLYERFKRFPREYISDVSFSFGKISYRKEEQLLEHVVDSSRRLGATSFRASLLNSFSAGVDEAKYAQIRSEIDRCLTLGFEVIRINDSVGLLYPEAAAILAANLVHDFPGVNFCLHAHDDRGLGLANALASIENGFSMIEGAVAGFGNRSGLPQLECIELVLREKRIRVKDITLQPGRIRNVARLADEVFTVVPDVYRPVSGKLVNKENFGVLNIPDFLGVDREDIDYFFNPVGLYPATVTQILKEASFDERSVHDHRFVYAVRSAVEAKMWETAWIKGRVFHEVLQRIDDLYGSGVVSPSDVIEYGKRCAEGVPET
jgi:2-isopropylmalate synthase